MLSVIAASPASATVLSASNQAVGTKSSKADYLKVTTVQSELNATMAEVNDAAVANGSVSAPAPATGGPGFVLQKDGQGGGEPREPGDPWQVITPDDGRVSGRLAVPVSSRGTRAGTYNDQRDGRRGGGGGGGGGRRGGAHANPEPSTWMLLGAGLALMGGYAVLRRRAVFEG
jgi:hypothetical protein